MHVEADILKCFRAGILAIDPSGCIIYLNEIAIKILSGVSIRIGENLRMRVEENAFFRMVVEALDLRYLPTRMEATITGKEGMNRSIGFTLAELKEEDRRVGICAFFKDLTHVEMAEENRDLNDRLRLLGQMAAGLAHEIRNPIASIGVHCGLLRSRFQDNTRILSSLAHIDREIVRVEYIIRECLNFVRPTDLGVVSAPVAPLLEGIVAETEKMHAGVSVSFHIKGAAMQEVEMDESLMRQALVNIVANAVQACNGKGNVVISARVTRGYWDLDPNARETMLFDASGEREDFLTISIKDDGPGIPEEVRDKIFVPFFTTKKEGTGIGLPIAQKIVYAHKGVLDILSEPGKGTEFIIKLPVRQTHV